MRYALINPQGQIDRFASNIDPTVATKAGWKWLPSPGATPPAFNGATEEREGPAFIVGDLAVTEVYNVRALTPGELDARKEAKLNALDALQFAIQFAHENRLRVLESKAPVSAGVFRAALKALL